MPASKREMTVSEAVKLLPGMSAETLKKWLRDSYLMKARPCPFGDGVLSAKGEWQYYIYPARINAYRNARDLTLTATVEPDVAIRIEGA